MIASQDSCSTWADFFKFFISISVAGHVALVLHAALARSNSRATFFRDMCYLDVLPRERLPKTHIRWPRIDHADLPTAIIMIVAFGL